MVRYLNHPDLMTNREGKGDRVMDYELAACRDGRMTFDELAKRTRPSWEKLAQYLLRRWKSPTWVSDVEDVVQDLLLGAWLAIQEWDPSYPGAAPLKSFVIFNSVDKAKKRVHQMRKAKRRDDKAPSRHMVPVSSLHREGEDPLDVADLVIAFADQDLRLEAGRLLRDVPPELFPALQQYLNEGSISQAAWQLLEDVARARELGITTHREAALVVERALGALIDDEAWTLLENQARREKLKVSTLSEARRALLSA